MSSFLCRFSCHNFVAVWFGLNWIFALVKWLAGKIIPKLTYNVSIKTLTSTIPVPDSFAWCLHQSMKMRAFSEFATFISLWVWGILYIQYCCLRCVKTSLLTSSSLASRHSHWALPVKHSLVVRRICLESLWCSDWRLISLMIDIHDIILSLGKQWIYRQLGIHLKMFYMCQICYVQNVTKCACLLQLFAPLMF